MTTLGDCGGMLDSRYTNNKPYTAPCVSDFHHHRPQPHARDTRQLRRYGTASLTDRARAPRRRSARARPVPPSHRSGGLARGRCRLWTLPSLDVAQASSAGATRRGSLAVRHRPRCQTVPRRNRDGLCAYTGRGARPSPETAARHERGGERGAQRAPHCASGVRTAGRAAVSNSKAETPYRKGLQWPSYSSAESTHLSGPHHRHCYRQRSNRDDALCQPLRHGGRVAVRLGH